MINLINDLSYQVEIERVETEQNGEIVISGWSIDMLRSKPLALDIKVDGQAISHTRFEHTDRAMRLGLDNPGSIGFRCALPASTSIFEMVLHYPAGDKKKTFNVKEMQRRERNAYMRYRAGTILHIPEYIATRSGRDRLRQAFERRFKVANSQYQKWIQANEKFDEHTTQAEIAKFKLQPTISIVVPVYNVEEKWLRRCVESVQQQWYGKWELCIADDNSSEPHVRRVLEELAAGDSRIKIVFRESNGRISAATNSAIELASGSYIGFMDNDDELAPNALFEVVSSLNHHPETDFFYSDEDKIREDGSRFDPFFKPGFSPNLLLSHNYITHFVVVSEALLEKVGNLRGEFDGSQDYDFVLRATEQAKNVEHIAKILYHWRTLPSSVAGDPRSKMYAYEAGKKALEDALQRRNIRAHVDMLDNLGTYKITRILSKQPFVTVVTKNLSSEELDFLQNETDYPEAEFISSPAGTDISALTMSGEYIVFLDGVVPEGANWLAEMIDKIQDPSVGIVGGKIYDTQHRITNAGVTLRALKTGKPFEMRNEWEEGIGYYFRTILPREMFGITEDCLLISRADFLALNGFDQKTPVGIKGIDLCERLRNKTGKAALWQPYATFIDKKDIPLKISEESIRGYLKSHKNLFDPFAAADFPPEHEKSRSRIAYVLDSVVELDGGEALKVSGWALDRIDSAEVTVSIPQGASYEIETYDKILRGDVNQKFPVAQSALLGFSIVLRRKSTFEDNSEPMQIIFEGGQGSQEAVVLEQASSAATEKLRKGVRVIKSMAHPRQFTHRLSDRLLSGPLQERAYKKLIGATENYDLDSVRQEIQGFSYAPMISFVVPVYNVEPKWLKRCVESMQQQYYKNWELCLADDCSTDSRVKETLEELQDQDPRIKVVYREKNGHISRATNSALEIATGEFIALVDNDDEIPPFALFEVVKALNDGGEYDVVYSDEDKIDEHGHRFAPVFKPDFAPDLLLSTNYISHLGVYRMSIAREIGGFRPGYEGSQDYDFLLRFIEHSDRSRVRHVPKVLYHWRTLATSTASGASTKSYASEAGLKALQSALDRRRIDAVAKPQPVPGIYDIDYAIKEPQDLVSVIIPTKNGYDNIDRVLKSIIDRTTYRNYEVIVADNGSTNPAMKELYRRYQKEMGKRLRIESIDIPFNFSRINNLAAKTANGKYLLFLNDDTEVISPSWMSKMVSFAQQDRIGVVGAKLYFGDETIQHAGIVLGLGGVAGHILAGTPRSHVGYFGRLIENVNYYAVTAACCMIRSEDFWAVGGFDEKLDVAYNDVDLCIRIHDELRKDVVWPHEVQLHHYESLTRGYDIEDKRKQQRMEREAEKVRRKYPKIIAKDPYYNPNLSRTSSNFWIRSV